MDTDREQRIPFDGQQEIPNADTIAAMKESEEMEKHPEHYRRYPSFDELLRKGSADA